MCVMWVFDPFNRIPVYDKIPPFNRISALAIDNCNQSSPCWPHTSRSSSPPFFGELFMPGFTCGVASCKERQELSWAEIGATHIGATYIRGATHIILKGNPHQGQPFSRQLHIRANPYLSIWDNPHQMLPFSSNIGSSAVAATLYILGNISIT